MNVHVCKHRCKCAGGECFSHFCNISACVRVSGFKQKASPGPRPLESSACEGQVWFRKRQGRLAWKWNLLSLCQMSRLTECPQPLITSKSILSSRHPLLLLVWPPLHTNIRITQQRNSSEMALFNDHDVKQCLHEKETWIQLLAAARNHLLKAELSLLVAVLRMTAFAFSHF